MSRARNYWTDEEISILIDMVTKGVSRKDIYAYFTRHPYYSVKQKIRKLGLSGKIDYGMNEYVENGETTIIIMRDMDWNAYECLIDTEDMEFALTCGRWHIAKRNNDIYATVRIGKKDQYLHRLIMDCPKGMLVDHINGNTLDCRKSNLRIVTAEQNRQNQHVLNKRNHSGYRGVSWCKIHKKWRAVIKVNRKQIGNKYFDDKEQAHQYVVALRAKYMPYSSDARGIINL